MMNKNSIPITDLRSILLALLLVCICFLINGCPEDKPPVADAGADRYVQISDAAGLLPAYLDGSGSHDPESDILSFFWKVLDAPLGSSAVVVDDTAMVAKLMADRPGEYLIRLTVAQVDDPSKSSQDEVLISAIPVEMDEVVAAGACWGSTPTIISQLKEQMDTDILVEATVWDHGLHSTPWETFWMYYPFFPEVPDATPYLPIDIPVNELGFQGEYEGMAPCIHPDAGSGVLPEGVTVPEDYGYTWQEILDSIPGYDAMGAEAQLESPSAEATQNPRNGRSGKSLPVDLAAFPSHVEYGSNYRECTSNSAFIEGPDGVPWGAVVLNAERRSGFYWVYWDEAAGSWQMEEIPLLLDSYPLYFDIGIRNGQPVVAYLGTSIVGIGGLRTAARNPDGTWTIDLVAGGEIDDWTTGGIAGFGLSMTRNAHYILYGKLLCNIENGICHSHTAPYIASWNGSSWVNQRLDEIMNNQFGAYIQNDIALRSDLGPYDPESGDRRIYMTTFNALTQTLWYAIYDTTLKLIEILQVNEAGEGGEYPSLAVDEDESAYIVYADVNHGDLMVATKSAGAASFSRTILAQSGALGDSDIALLPAGGGVHSDPVVAYTTDSGLAMAYRTDVLKALYVNPPKGDSRSIEQRWNHVTYGSSSDGFYPTVLADELGNVKLFSSPLAGDSLLVSAVVKYMVQPKRVLEELVDRKHEALYIRLNEESFDGSYKLDDLIDDLISQLDLEGISGSLDGLVLVSGTILEDYLAGEIKILDGHYWITGTDIDVDLGEDYPGKITLWGQFNSIGAAATLQLTLFSGDDDDEQDNWWMFIKGSEVLNPIGLWVWNHLNGLVLNTGIDIANPAFRISGQFVEMDGAVYFEIDPSDIEITLGTINVVTTHIEHIFCTWLDLEFTALMAVLGVPPPPELVALVDKLCTLTIGNLVDLIKDALSSITEDVVITNITAETISQKMFNTSYYLTFDDFHAQADFNGISLGSGSMFTSVDASMVWHGLLSDPCLSYYDNQTAWLTDDPVFSEWGLIDLAVHESLGGNAMIALHESGLFCTDVGEVDLTDWQIFFADLPDTGTLHMELPNPPRFAVDAVDGVTLSFADLTVDLVIYPDQPSPVSVVISSIDFTMNFDYDQADNRITFSIDTSDFDESDISVTFPDALSEWIDEEDISNFMSTVIIPALFDELTLDDVVIEPVVDEALADVIVVIDVAHVDDWIVISVGLTALPE